MSPLPLRTCLRLAFIIAIPVSVLVQTVNWLVFDGGFSIFTTVLVTMVLSGIAGLAVGSSVQANLTALTGFYQNQLEETIMGFYHSAYFAYGVQVPDTNINDLEEKLYDHTQQHGGDVGYLDAGSYDRHMTFLVTHCFTATLGQHKTVTPGDFDTDTVKSWNDQLQAAATALGFDDTEVSTPGWLLIPDMS